jgi:hypothetical protein
MALIWLIILALKYLTTTTCGTLSEYIPELHGKLWKWSG